MNQSIAIPAAQLAPSMSRWLTRGVHAVLQVGAHALSAVHAWCQARRRVARPELDVRELNLHALRDINAPQWLQQRAIERNAAERYERMRSTMLVNRF